MCERSFNPSAFGAIALVAALMTAPVLSQQPSDESTSQLRFETDQSVYDGELGRLVSTGVRIRQGDFEIRADRAEAASLEFTNTTWFFWDNIYFRKGTASLGCDQAELEFVDGRLKAATIRGKPVTMRNEGKSAVDGTADRIEFDTESGLARLLGNAVLETRESRVSGDSITFDLNAETVTVAPGDGEPVQFLFEFFASPADE